MNKLLIIILVILASAIIFGGIVYLILNKEIQEWRLVISTQQERLSALKN